MPSSIATSWPAVVRAFFLGVAAGGRSSAGLAAAVWSASGAAGSRDPRWLSTPAAHVVTAVMIGGEAVTDKRPSSPSRLQPPALVVRITLGAVAGALLARRAGAPILAGAVAGKLGAISGSFLGARWRAVAAARFGPDLPGALIEDALVAAVATAAVR